MIEKQWENQNIVINAPDWWEEIKFKMHFLKILAILLSLTVAVINAQNSFSPFSFLNSFLSQVPGWPLQHNPGHHHHHNTVKQQQQQQQQRSNNKQKQNIFRPHLQLSPSISSQVDIEEIE